LVAGGGVVPEEFVEGAAYAMAGVRTRAAISKEATVRFAILSVRCIRRAFRS
jgi:hypothetical protein